MSFRERIEAVRNNSKLTDEERKAQLNEIYDDMDADLEAKSKDLTRWKQEARKKSEVNVDDVAKLEAEVERLTTENASLSKSAKKFELEAKTSTEKLSAEQRRIQNLEVDRALTETLTKAKIKPEHLPYVKAGLRDKVNLEPDGDGFKVVAKWKDKDGKDSAGSLSDFIEKHWAQGEGKSFIPADQNGGSGGKAPGSAGGSGKTMSRAELQNLDPAAQIAFAKEGGTLTD